MSRELKANISEGATAGELDVLNIPIDTMDLIETACVRFVENPETKEEHKRMLKKFLLAVYKIRR